MNIIIIVILRYVKSSEKNLFLWGFYSFIYLLGEILFRLTEHKLNRGYAGIVGNK